MSSIVVAFLNPPLPDVYKLSTVTIIFNSLEFAHEDVALGGVFSTAERSHGAGSFLSARVRPRTM